MPDVPILLQTAFASGIVLSVVLTIIMGVSLALARDMWVGDYPPDIKERYGTMSPRARRLRPYIALPFFLSAFAVPLLGLLTLRGQTPFGTFGTAFLFAFVVLLTFNTYDLLVLDWLLFCTIRPRWIVLPGTEGMAGYQDYRFHFIGFLKGFAFCAVGGLTIALLWVGITSLIP